MLRIMLLILIIQANCMKIYCDEAHVDGELAATERTAEISEKTLDPSASAESLKTTVKNKEINEEKSKASKDSLESRVSRSSSNNAIEKEAQADDNSNIHSVEASFTEKSATDEITEEIIRGDNKEVQKPKTEINIAEAHQDKAIPVDDLEKQSEEISETSRSAAGIEDRKSMEILEASAESKINDYEKASYKDLNETKEIKEKSNESGLDESLPTRRMLSGPDYIVTVLDTKTRADTTPAELDIEVKIVPSQKFNTNNKFNEFGTQGKSKLTVNSQTELTTPPIPIKTNSPVATRVASQEILEQQYLPKFYPQAELNMRFPNSYLVNSDFQAPRDIPAYLKIKQDEFQFKNQNNGAHNPPFTQTQPTDENRYFYPKIRQQNHLYHRTMDSRKNINNQEFQNLGIETRNQIPQSQSRPQNKVEFANRNQNSSNLVQQMHQNQEIANYDHKRFENINRDSRNQIQGIVNTNMATNNKEFRNEYPFYSSRMAMEPKLNLENKQIRSDGFVNPYPYLPRVQQPSSQENNLHNIFTRTDSDVVPKKVKILFQKLANASQFPLKISTNLFNYPNNDVKTNAYFINPNHKVNLIYHGPS